jgi:hypothetical protein
LRDDYDIAWFSVQGLTTIDLFTNPNRHARELKY